MKEPSWTNYLKLINMLLQMFKVSKNMKCENYKLEPQNKNWIAYNDKKTFGCVLWALGLEIIPRLNISTILIDKRYTYDGVHFMKTKNRQCKNNIILFDVDWFFPFELWKVVFHSSIDYLILNEIECCCKIWLFVNAAKEAF